MTKFIRINKLEEISSPGLGGHRYLLSFDVGEMSGNVFKPIDSRHATVTSSGTLQAVWGQNDSQMRQSAATAATSFILTTVASQGSLDDLEIIKLTTYSAPETPPKGPQALPGAIIAVPEREAVKEERPNMSFLSDDIAEVRDQINALSRDMFGGRLLELPQERAILDIYKPAESPEEFRSRVQSLAGMCTAVNKKLIGQHLKKDLTTRDGILMLLEELLTSLCGSLQATEVCNILKNINHLRKGYPAHGDYIDKFLPAHDFFQVPYPITDFAAAWDEILGGYFHAMKSLSQILADNRSKVSADRTYKEQ
jgi:hypothetical protein